MASRTWEAQDKARPRKGLLPATLQVVGLVLQRRRFSALLPFETAGSGQTNFRLDGPVLPEGLDQFQEVIDIVLESLPTVDWDRCRRGDALVQLMVKQLLARPGPRHEDRHRSQEPDDEQEVFMDFPHHDDYWPGADYFAASDAPHRTLFYPNGRDEMPLRFPAGAVVRYDALTLHSAPGFCAASIGKNGNILRTFVRIMAWDPLWTLERYPQAVPLLGAGPEKGWQRPEACQAEDVVQGCFDSTHPCERCCDLSRGANGDAGCWAGWMTYKKCCGPASRRWAGCGWRSGVDRWAHEYYSLEPPRLHSAAQCQQRCAEDPSCGGWSYFRAGWRPPYCRLPLAAIIGLRRVCLLRASADLPPTRHAGLVIGPRNCEDSSANGCVEHDIDRLGYELGFLREVKDVATCRARCKTEPSCAAFAYFPDDYTGDWSSSCLLAPAVSTWFEQRCLLKVGATRGGPNFFMELGDVVSGSRACPPAAPWRARTDGSFVGSPAADFALALDGDYRREECASESPWRAEFDAEYVVTEVVLWLGSSRSSKLRPPRVYGVYLVTTGTDDKAEEVLCDVVHEAHGGGPAVVACESSSSQALDRTDTTPEWSDRVPASVSGGKSARGIVVRAEHADDAAEEDMQGDRNAFKLCELEVRVEPVPCARLIEEMVQIHSHEVRLFPMGEASRVQASESSGHSQACERRGGSLVRLHSRGDMHVCVEAACAPSICLEAFDAAFDHYRQLSMIGLRDERIEAAEESCIAGRRGSSSINPPIENNELGRFFEATVLVHGVSGTRDGGGPDATEGPGDFLTMHWSFCAPASCLDDEAARGAARLAASQGLAQEFLPLGAEVEFRNVRPLGRWEDVRLDFLIAGFARSGTHSARGNLAAHPSVRMSADELTFNWAYVPLVSQLEAYAASFPAPDYALADGYRDSDFPSSSSPARQLLGGKGEGVALNQRLLKHLARVPQLRLVVLVREPIEWLESLYNLRAFECDRYKSCGHVPSLEDVILRGASFEDVRLQDAFFSNSLEVAAKIFLPSGRFLLLEFELLRQKPREFYDRLTSFLDIPPYPRNYTFGKFATEDRAQYSSSGRAANLCSEEMRPALDSIVARMRQTNEHLRLAQLVAATGADWVSERLVAGRPRCSWRR